MKNSPAGRSDRSGAAQRVLIRTVFEGRDSETVGRSTGAGLFVPSPLGELFDLFEAVNLRGYGCMADLGSGDGRVVMAASVYTEAHGFEVDSGLNALSRAQAQVLGLDRVGFSTADFYQADLSRFDLLYIYPDKPPTELIDRFKGRLKADLLVYGPMGRGLDLPLKETFELDINPAFLYRLA